MITGKMLLLAAILAGAPLTATAASAQDQRTGTDARQQNSTTDRNRQDQRDMSNRDMSNRDNRDMHRGWHNGRRYGHRWHRHCMMMWRHHHRVRVCR